MKVVPLGDKLVVRRLDPTAVTAAGIVLPDEAQDAPCQGRVLSVGDGALLPDGSRAAPEVHEGDRVVFGQFAGDEVSIDHEKLLILRAADVLAVVR